MLEEEDETFWNTDREIRDVETEETSPVREEGGESTCRKDSSYKSYISNTGEKSNKNDINDKSDKSPVLSLDDW